MNRHLTVWDVVNEKEKIMKVTAVVLATLFLATPAAAGALVHKSEPKADFVSQLSADERALLDGTYEWRCAARLKHYNKVLLPQDPQWDKMYADCRSEMAEEMIKNRKK